MLPRGKVITEDALLAPSAIAETYYQIYRQHRSAWTNETELRPFAENSDRRSHVTKREWQRRSLGTPHD